MLFKVRNFSQGRPNYLLAPDVIKPRYATGSATSLHGMMKPKGHSLKFTRFENYNLTWIEHSDVKSLKINVSLNYIWRFSSYLTVKTFRLSYKKTNQWMMCKEVISLSFGNHMQHKNKLCQEKVHYLNTKLGSTQQLLRLKELKFQILRQSQGCVRPFLSPVTWRWLMRNRNPTFRGDLLPSVPLIEILGISTFVFG